jgi:glycosyltransferase involved in cell wall biosynthesis
MSGIKAPWQVMPNPVDVRRFTPASEAERAATRRRLGLGPEPVALCIGRLREQKGQDLLLDAWPSVQSEVPEARLVFVGDGPMRAELEGRASERVTFAGWQDDVSAWLHAADVVVQPSRYEGLCLSVLEAMASGRSVVATDVAGMAETLGEAGAVVALDDSKGLGVALVERLSDPGRTSREGQAGRVRAQKNHDVREWAERMAELALSVAQKS